MTVMVDKWGMEGLNHAAKLLEFIKIDKELRQKLASETNLVEKLRIAREVIANKKKWHQERREHCAFYGIEQPKL